MSLPKFPKALPRKIGDLFIDGYDIYRWTAAAGSNQTLLNLKTGEHVELHSNRVGFFTHITAGQVIDTGAEPVHVVNVSQSPGFDITYTLGERTAEITRSALDFVAFLAERRANAYGAPGQIRRESDARVKAVRDILRAAKVAHVSVNLDPDKQRADAVIHHNADLDPANLPDTLEVVAHGGRWIAVNVKEAAPEDVDDDDDLAVTDEDLAEDAALTDEDLERLTGEPLPPVDDELLDPGEPQDIPAALLDESDEQPAYRKGDQILAADGMQYKVLSVDGQFVRLKHAAGEINVRVEDVPGLLKRKPAETGINWHDETVRVSAELLTAQARIRQLEEEVARLHEADRDTEPLAPETVKEAVRASQEMAQIQLIPMEEYKIESKTLAPINLLIPERRLQRDAEIIDLRNEGWFVVYEQALYAADGDMLYHIVRLERSIEDDDPGQGEPERRDILDQANDIIDAYEPDDTPDADSEALETETDLQPVPQAFRNTEYPITATIRMVGADAVKDFYNTQVCEAFNLARGRASVPAIPGEVTS